MPSLISLPDQEVEFLYQGTLNFIIIGSDFFLLLFFWVLELHRNRNFDSLGGIFLTWSNI